MRGAVAAAWLFAAAGGADLSWVVDSELPSRIAGAESEATRLEASASQSDATRATVLAKRQAALTEKASLEAGLAGLSRGKKADAEKRIAALAADAEQADARAKQLVAEAAAFRTKAAAQRAFAAALAAEAKARAADEAKFAIDPDADLGQFPDARLRDSIAWRQRRLARVPKQLAALDAELDAANGISDRGAVVARKDAVRAASAEDQADVRRLTEELDFRADSKVDEAAAAAQLEAAAKAKALERATPAASPGSTPDHIDAALERILEKQDREAAERVDRAKTTRTFVRFAVAVGGFGALALVVVLALKGKART